ncbi:hypothetical protein BT96DRAFT_37043 [Gymnopus androsaceus JB14]|uniref:Uncharacterized protein n=1 Tax=Gymnopus androsaceus JB14 TaxID=1447944 RepID=A0A6A4HNK4_9AGAR|nr:hypothetical protein BT96DRAFT_37043 [Gymnopus androsaceus JB14]
MQSPSQKTLSLQSSLFDPEKSVVFILIFSENGSTFSSHRVIFFVGLSVVVRSLGPLFAHVKSETKSIISSARGNRTLYQNQTLDEVTDRSKVVQPLLGENQLFDIGVTIWARATVEEETEWRKSLRGMNTTAESNRRWGFHDGPVQLGSWSYWETSSYLLPSQLFPVASSHQYPFIHDDSLRHCLQATSAL